MVIESSRPVAEVAREIQVTKDLLAAGYTSTGSTMPARNHRCRSRSAPGYASANEVRELKMNAEFLGKAAAFFAEEYR